MGEAAKQLAFSIDHAVDEELFKVLAALPFSRKAAVDTLTADAVADALALFGDEMEGEKLLFTDAAGFTELRKDPGYIRAGDLGQRMIFSGVVGEIWGCQIVISSRLKEDAVTKEKQHFIVKPGALRLVSKQGTMLEVQREPEYMRDTLFASKHCAAYLYDAGRAVSLTKFTGLAALGADCGIRSEPGAAAGDTLLVIPEELTALKGYGWVYLKDTSAADKGTFGTAVTGSTAWAGNTSAIAAGANTFLHVLLVTESDKKPVKTFTTAVIAG